MLKPDPFPRSLLCSYKFSRCFQYYREFPGLFYNIIGPLYLSLTQNPSETETLSIPSVLDYTRTDWWQWWHQLEISLNWNFVISASIPQYRGHLNISGFKTIKPSLCPASLLSSLVLVFFWQTVNQSQLCKYLDQRPVQIVPAILG